jgi:hypothetical protein
LRTNFFLASALLLAFGCATVARVENLSDEACRRSFQNALASILVEQKEAPESSQELAERARIALEHGNLGPRPFLVSSSSGADYEFFVENRKSGCLLRLYGRQKGFTSYTNDLTYIATRPLPDCLCRE